MSSGGIGPRLTVFAVFVALAAAGFLPLLRGAPGAAVQPAELASLEKSLFERARLHPAVKPPAPVGSVTFCAGCHPLPPHSGRRVSDAMTNEHAARMDCLVCHWPEAGGPRPVPSWQVLSGTAFLVALPPERATQEQLAALRSTVTAARRCFQRGAECGGCHRPGGMGAFVRPGAAGGTAALERLENYFTLTPGEKWYFPQLK